MLRRWEPDTLEMAIAIAADHQLTCLRGALPPVDLRAV
eukprot:CAMPEP_0178700034 /NCGR_PEP_ID=MMETSP0699-20121125/11422_1 /TAXON_ID=265572 /ORGANISM="Extubocellulus spinifer, Strain CCMP396" /LENGTH=37 /DNA_ID= /DNA_START= /DNA_END= /DNA_ORIENTATION=